MAKKQQKQLDEMTDDELAKLRAEYDLQMQELRNKKLEIQRVLDRRAAERPRKKADHKIGIGG